MSVSGAVGRAVGIAVEMDLRVGDGGAGVEAERAGGRVDVGWVVPRPAPVLAEIVAVEIADTGRGGLPATAENKARTEQMPSPKTPQTTSRLLRFIAC